MRNFGFKGYDDPDPSPWWVYVVFAVAISVLWVGHHFL
jgi:hypothetical protein